MAKYYKIFAALDGGDTQEAVVRRALSVAHDNNAEVLFGHVIDSSKFETGGIADDIVVENTKKAISESIKPFLQKASQDVAVQSVDMVVKIGRITETLENEIIKPYDPDLVVCGVRGLSSIKYAFVGSVSTHLIHHMTCDVLIVHPEAIEPTDYEEMSQYL